MTGEPGFTGAARPIEKVVVVGAAGQMGALFVRLCREAGLSAEGLDKPLAQADLARAVPGADLVLLAVPIPAMDEVSRQVAAHMDGTAILADVCSVKTQPMRAMRRAYQGPVAGTHPLFGPVLPEPDERRVAVCPVRGCEAAAEAVSGFIARLGLVPFASTDREHDEAMAYMQGLNFVSTVSYLSAVASQPAIEDFVTPSFRRRLVSARKMMTQDSRLFETLFETNPFSLDAVRAFRSHLNVAAGGDVDLLVSRAQWWWRDEGYEGGA